MGDEGGDNPPEQQGVQDTQAKLLVDGLLSCIMKALSRSPSLVELVSVIDRESNELEVKSSWTKLFEHFNDAYDVTQKKKVKDINRQSTKIRIEDIVTQLGKLDKTENADFLVMPWNYKMKLFESDGEKLNNIMVEENAKDYDAKLQALEMRMEKKHGELLNHLQTFLHGAFAEHKKPDLATTFAGITARGGGGATGGSAGGAAGGAAAARQGNGRNITAGRVRSVSPSVKRFRADDGSSVASDVAGDTTNQGFRYQNKSKAAVTGTSDSNKTGRKMRSPPADIFVWGVHPDTTFEDIVNDLAASDIQIKESDILKKSKDEAQLCSYKISVPAVDLQRALDPSIWPLRVRVREFIHYARRNPRQQTGNGNAREQAQPSAQGGQGGRDGVASGPQGGAQGQSFGGARPKAGSAFLQVPSIELHNMFDALAKAKTL
jgi:hypothetical protein